MVKRPARSSGFVEGETIAAPLDFPDEGVLSALFGQFDENLIALETQLGVFIKARGARVLIEGGAPAVALAGRILSDFYTQVAGGGAVEPADIVAAVRLSRAAEQALQEESASSAGAAFISTRRKTIRARSAGQNAYMHAMRSAELVFALGPAGTGKTYLAVAQAVAQMMEGSVDRLILSRPAVEAGERLGFLPGDMREKVDPYLRPLYDALYDLMPGDLVERKLANQDIEIAPLAFMRGRTLANAFVILDEAQNTTPMQMKMFLTRFGERSRMVVCGDPEQVDLPNGAPSGLADAARRLDGVDGVRLIRFGRNEVVRHPLVGRIVDAYEGPQALALPGVVKRHADG